MKVSLEQWHDMRVVYSHPVSINDEDIDAIDTYRPYCVLGAAVRAFVRPTEVGLPSPVHAAACLGLDAADCHHIAHLNDEYAFEAAFEALRSLMVDLESQHTQSEAPSYD